MTELAHTSLRALVKTANDVFGAQKNLSTKQKALFEQGLKLGTSGAVHITGKTRQVFFTASKQPTPINREKCQAYTEKNKNAFALYQTPAGHALENLFEKLPEKLATSLINIASARYAMAVKGDTKAFWDNAHPQSTSMAIEAAHLIANPQAKTINGQDKTEYIKNIIAKRHPESWKHICKEAGALAQAQKVAIAATRQAKNR